VIRATTPMRHLIVMGALAFVVAAGLGDVGNVHAQEARIALGTNGAIAYSAQDGIHVVDADGTNDHVIIAGSALQPSWSPDGTRLLAVEGGATFGLRIFTAEGRAIATIVTPPGWKGPPEVPTWAPDAG